MSKHAKAILELGIGYLLSVAALELFLVKYEILAWGALGITFVVFGLLIFNVLLPLASKRKSGNPQTKEGNEDETQRLRKLVQRVQNGDLEATETLEKRLRSAALLITSYHKNALLTQQGELSRNSGLLEIMRDDNLVTLLTADSGVRAPMSVEEIQVILTALEDWIT